MRGVGRRIVVIGLAAALSSFAFARLRRFRASSGIDAGSERLGFLIDTRGRLAADALATATSITRRMANERICARPSTLALTRRLPPGLRPIDSNIIRDLAGMARRTVGLQFVSSINRPDGRQTLRNPNNPQCPASSVSAHACRRCLCPNAISVFALALR